MAASHAGPTTHREAAARAAAPDLAAARGMLLGLCLGLGGWALVGLLVRTAVG